MGKDVLEALSRYVPRLHPQVDGPFPGASVRDVLDESVVSILLKNVNIQ